MSDFFQNGAITTLHRLQHNRLAEMENELLAFSKERPMALVLPSLYSELQGPALNNIIEQIREIPYLSQIVIGLDRADRSEFNHAREFFSKLPQPHKILWNDGPNLQAIDRLLAEEGLAPIEPGKGRNVWYCYGYVLASRQAEAVALHDCDILTYNRELPARLFYPVANPSFNYEFCKGYYYRVADNKLNGRVCRLLVTPLIRALKQVIGNMDYLNYLDSFRYALSGEFATRVDSLKEIRIPSDWGLEIGVLSEIYRNHSSNHICQVEIADAYDHKHQELSEEDASLGLSRMSTDIAKAIYRKLATQGVIFNKETFRTLKATYYRTALDAIEAYYNDACINGLKLDRHQEEKTVELFTRNIMRAGDSFLDNPMETPFMPSWNRVISAVPDIMQRLDEAVEKDNTQ
ncbi:glycosyl transferase [Methylotuvimicrobium buryatense]|uniref:Glycosyl transferase n=1 Tax=Methylotuvimicrobium buryatense TaxID=95641 RepID=A0A4P9UST6_METBY|nr:glycosyl transferase [Methylotuvimicrobium buryatense]QCW83610.1 glycosyl transferase [Methylotuvimicrobium buryatense]